MARETAVWYLLSDDGRPKQVTGAQNKWPAVSIDPMRWETTMIIFGSKMYGVRNVVRGFDECEHCECYAQHKSYSGRKWGHVYFIPLFPMGGRVRVLREC